MIGGRFELCSNDWSPDTLRHSAWRILRKLNVSGSNSYIDLLSDKKSHYEHFYTNFLTPLYVLQRHLPNEAHQIPALMNFNVTHQPTVTPSPADRQRSRERVLLIFGKARITSPQTTAEIQSSNIFWWATNTQGTNFHKIWHGVSHMHPTSLQSVFIHFWLSQQKIQKQSEKSKLTVFVRECLLPLSAEPFVFQFAIQKFKDQDI